MSDILTELGSATVNPFVNIWNSILNHLPGIIGAIFVACLGYIIAYFIGSLIKHSLQKAGLDKWILKKNLSKTVLNIKLSVLVGQLIKWGVFISFLVPAAELIRLSTFAFLLSSFALWIPKLILAIVIVTFGLIISKLVAVEIHNKGNKTSQIVSKIIHIVLIILFLNIALTQINVSTVLIEKIILLVIGSILLFSAIVIGISFGVAGKKYADRIIDDYLLKKKKTKK
jgi:hypothetical protein